MRFDEPVSAHSALGIGGRVEALVDADDAEGLKRVMGWAEERSVEFRFLGKGSALYVLDGGMRGLLIRLGKDFSGISLERQEGEEALVLAGGAVPLRELRAFCLERGFAIPAAFLMGRGTVAGALLRSIWDGDASPAEAVEELTIVTRERRELTMRSNGIRQEEGMLKVPRTAAIARALLRLRKGDGAEAPAGGEGAALQAEGVFRSPCKTSAAVLIEEAGLPGVRIGGARVSAQDANTVINENRATARDIAVLLELVRDRVREQTGITLIPTVEFVGEK